MNSFFLTVLAVAVGLGAGIVRAQDAAPTEPLLLGSGAYRYEWIHGFAAPADGSDLGRTHGAVAIDSRGRIYFNTDTERAVQVFDSEGHRLATWGAEFAGGLHGMTIRREGDEEFVYLAHTGRAEVVKATLDGKVLWTIPWPAQSGLYEKREQFRPTDVAIAPDGRIFVTDGYGKGYVHVFDADRKWVMAFGGPGVEPGKMRVPHGLCMDARDADRPSLIVADRENGRLQWFDLDGNLLAVVSGIFRRPCDVAIHPNGRDLVVPDLGGRVTLLDGRNRLIEHLGDQPDPELRARDTVPRNQWRDGRFLAPHGAAFGPNGDLYVLDWSNFGRVTHLRHVARAAPDGGERR